MSQEDGNVK